MNDEGRQKIRIKYSTEKGPPSVKLLYGDISWSLSDKLSLFINKTENST